MEYRLIRSGRKSVAICIDRDGGVVVRAPRNLPQSVIERFVTEKREWIAEKSALMQSCAAARRVFVLREGSVLPLLGMDRPVLAGERAAFDGAHFLLPRADFQAPKPKLQALYRAVAAREIPARVASFSERTGWIPSAVGIGNAATSWGSCSGKNRLIFSWRLMMAGPDEIDYVVVHELAHTVEHNHSSRFWTLVAGVLPDYQKRRKALRLLSHRMQEEGWS